MGQVVQDAGLIQGDGFHSIGNGFVLKIFLCSGAVQHDIRLIILGQPLQLYFQSGQCAPVAGDCGHGGKGFIHAQHSAVSNTALAVIDYLGKVTDKGGAIVG